jgi:hypothetical protein
VNRFFARPDVFFRGHVGFDESCIPLSQIFCTRSLTVRLVGRAQLSWSLLGRKFLCRQGWQADQDLLPIVSRLMTNDVAVDGLHFAVALTKTTFVLSHA